MTYARPQESHPDLGLNPEADQTEDMRKAPAATEALQKNIHRYITSREEVRHEV